MNNLFNMVFADNASQVEQARSLMKDYMNHYFSETRGIKGSFDTTKSLEEKNATLSKLMCATVERLSGVNMSNTGISAEIIANNPNVRWASMATINSLIDFVMPTVLVNGIGTYTNVVNGGAGDSFTFDIKPNDLFTVTKAGRNKRTGEVQRGFDGTKTIIPVNHQITVGCNLYRILIGLDNFAEFVLKAIVSMEAEMRLESYNLLNTTLSALATTPSGGALKVAGFTKSSAIKLANIVKAYNNGSKPVFLGTLGALADMTAEANFRYTEDSDLFKLGRFSNYAGFDLMEIEQVAKWNDKYKLALDDEKIFVVSPAAQKLIQLGYQGSTMENASDKFDYANGQQTLTINKAWGMAVATNATAGVITLG